LLFTVTTTTLPWDFFFFKLTQPLTNSVKEKGGKTDRKPNPLPYGLRNPHRNLKSENTQDYARNSKWNFTFMNSASVRKFHGMYNTYLIGPCTKKEYSELQNFSNFSTPWVKLTPGGIALSELSTSHPQHSHSGLKGFQIVKK
jgi:hypothetical protein